MKKLLTFAAIAALALVLTGCPKNTDPTNQTSDPTENPSEPAVEKEAGALDLSKFDTGYDSATGYVTLKNVASAQIPLTVAKDETWTIHVTGTNNGELGFRSWLIDNSQGTNSNVDTTFSSAVEGSSYVAGDFDITYDLTATADSTYLFFKFVSWGNPVIDDIVIKTVAAVKK